MIIKRIAVIGTGLMGKGISHVLAAAGYKVDLFGRRNEIREEFLEYLDKDVKKVKMTPAQKDTIIDKIGFYNINLQSERLTDNDLMIETVSEELNAKKEILSIMSKYASDTAILASNTSSYSISHLASFTGNPGNFLGMHFFSPVPLMKLVEVVRDVETNETVLQAVCRLVEGIDKLPVHVKDSPGFVLNRGLFVMVNEAVYMLSEGIAASAVDIDNIFINGMGMKVGPLKLADLVGLDVVYTIMSNLYDGFNDDKYTACPLLKQMLDEGKLGKKSGEGFYKY